MRPTRVREAIFDSTGEVIPLNKREWPNIAKAIADLAEIVELDSDESIWESRIDQYVRTIRRNDEQEEDEEDEYPHQQTNWKGKSVFSLIALSEPFILGGVIHIAADHLRAYIGMQFHEVVSIQETGVALSSMGFKGGVQVKRTRGDETMNKRYWLKRTPEHQEDPG